MARVSVVGINSVMRDIKTAISREIDQYAEELTELARANTPIKSGNARRNWNNKRTKQTGFTVENRVPYIERLEAGHSKQAPKGMVGPTLTQIKRRS